jgi:putative ABC transport system permease protein
VTLTYVLMQNLRRNPLRTGLTAVAFALPMAVFVAAISMVVALVQLGAANERELRLGVHHRITLTNSLPEGMRRRIEALDPDRERLRAVCGMRWFGGRVPGAQNALTSLAADMDTFPVVYSDVGLSEADLELWHRDRTAAITGSAPAEQYGWKVGQRITLESTVPPYMKLEFHIIKVLEPGSRDNFFYFRRDYLNEAREALGEVDSGCNIFWIKCQTAAGLRSLQAEIDETFRNTPDATKSEDENAFGANFTQAAGDIPGLMRAVAGVVVFIVALVAGNTMMMSFRERTRELAVFKAMGFQSGRVFRIVLAESMFLALIGSLIGVLPTALFLWSFSPRIMRAGPIGRLEVSPMAVAVSIGIALAVGVVSGFWPAYQAQRLNTADALRRVA